MYSGFKHKCVKWVQTPLGPYSVTVTESMVRQRERENQELIRRWEHEQRRLQRMQDPDDYYGDFKELNIRRRFIRRVFSLLAVQLVFAALMIGAFVFLDEARIFMLMHTYLIIISAVAFLVTYFSIMCSQCARHTPCSAICLVILTVSMAYVTAAACIRYSTNAVLYAAIATAVVTIVIAGVATCTKFDLTKHTGFFLIIALVGGLGLMAILIAYFFTRISTLQVAFGLLGALIISMYLFYDVQTIMGGRMIEISPDEVVFATTQLYVDILMLFRYILYSCNQNY